MTQSFLYLSLYFSLFLRYFSQALKFSFNVVFSFIVVYSRQARCCFDGNLANIVVSELLKSVQNKIKLTS